MVKTNELIALYDDEIAEANIKIEEINKNIDVNYDLFKNWLQMTQLFGDLNPLEMIFSADSFIEFLENIKFNCLVETKKADAFIADIIERTDGRSAPRLLGEEYLPLSEK